MLLLALITILPNENHLIENVFAINNGICHLFSKLAHLNQYQAFIEPYLSRNKTK